MVDPVIPIGSHRLLVMFTMMSINQCKITVQYGGGEAGKLHPGLWKVPPRLLENPTQGLGPPRLLENSTQAFGKSHPGFWKTTKFARTMRLYFLR
jgi:hypothetical protein